jgi:hypothetical protein
VLFIRKKFPESVAIYFLLCIQRKQNKETTLWYKQIWTITARDYGRLTLRNASQGDLSPLLCGIGLKMTTLIFLAYKSQIKTISSSHGLGS